MPALIEVYFINVGVLEKQAWPEANKSTYRKPACGLLFIGVYRGPAWRRQWHGGPGRPQGICIIGGHSIQKIVLKVKL